MVSASGHCRPFDVRADGTIFGSGVGVVVLKPLQDAVENGDPIHAVISGSAINNDGSTKMNYAAPNAAGQAEAIAEAHAVADIDSSTVSYVETHGTGTPLGDPVEIEGLRQAFGVSTASRPGPCILGSVKSNIGHLEVASGIASLIKTILCLKHQAIPGTLHYTSPNPELHLDRGPFVVRSEYGPWEWDGVRRAGVSSFGVGGTNVHVVLEEAPAVPTPAIRPGPQVLLLSARTAEALEQSRSALAAELSGPDELNMSDVAFTLAGRRQGNIRMAAVVNDQQHAAEVLCADEHDNVFVGESVASDESNAQSNCDRVVFLFPGQGAQHVGMARGLYESEPVFAKHFDESAAGFREELGIDLRAEVFDGSGRNLERTDRAQPALFAVEYALAKLIESYGVRAGALAGHSIGEYVAATVGDVFDLPTAVKVVSMRARLMHASPRGVMVAVALSPDAIGEYLSPDVDLAAVNDPDSCVVAGTDDNIRKFQDRLAEQGIAARRVRTSHAFHSRLMDPVIPEFTGFLSRLTLREPQIPLLSNITGTWMSPSEATNPATWARQIRATVRFSDELDVLLTDPSRVVVEVGPGGTLTASAMRHPRWSAGHRAVRLMRHQAQNKDDHATFLLSLGQLSSAGIDVDWTPLSAGERQRQVSLPGYPFVQHRHWVDHNATAAGAGGYRCETGWRLRRHPAIRMRRPQTAQSPMETTLQRIWAQCLGVGSVDRNANFFELGGDSLIAISVAMTAANEGLDLTPQDLYENQTVAALAKALVARYAAGGLARQSARGGGASPCSAERRTLPRAWVTGGWPVAHSPDPATSPRCAGRGYSLGAHRRDQSSRCAAAADCAARGNVGAAHRRPEEFTELATASLPDGLAPGSAQERDGVLDILNEHIRGQDLSSPPLTATYIRGLANGPCYLAISVHGIAGDNASRDILLTDLFTAFGQRLAGRTDGAATGHHTVARVVTAVRRARHPSRSRREPRFLARHATRATLRVASQRFRKRPESTTWCDCQSTLTASETTEIDDARRRLRLPIDDILLAALARTIAATVGDGAVAVDLSGPGRSVLKPDVDLRRTVGWFTTVYPVALTCTKVAHERQATAGRGARHGESRPALWTRVRAVAVHVCTDRAASSAACARRTSSSRTWARFPTCRPCRPTMLPFSSIPTRRCRCARRSRALVTPSNSGCIARLVCCIWIGGMTPAGSSRPMAESLAERFPIALMELTREAMAEDEMESAGEELALVDLSSTDIGIGEANAQH